MPTMTAIREDSSPTPLAQLSDMLSGDMDQVNAAIMRQMQSDVPLIPQLAGYLIAAGGKRIRPLLTLAATRLFDQTTDRCYDLSAAVEFIHTATLLHDDVVDESAERRGQAAANLIYGNQASVLVGDYLFARAFELMTRDGSLDVLRILSRAAAVIAEGEVLQLSIKNQIDATLDQYLEVIHAKTAALFAAATEIGPHMANQPQHAEALRTYGTSLGMAFQVADDILDYDGDTAQTGKAVGDDFREGKLTAPVLLALQNATFAEQSFWERTMQKRDQHDGDLEQAIAILRKQNAFEGAYALAQAHALKAEAALSSVPASPLRDVLIALPRYVIDRRS